MHLICLERTGQFFLELAGKFSPQIFKTPVFARSQRTKSGLLFKSRKPVNLSLGHRGAANLMACQPHPIPVSDLVERVTVPFSDVKALF